ncbi:MAG: 16S rRNA (cytosine(1402)-N(4))-methyltransferase RsmH [Synergistaceae bacterium]|nr:16S rRNA (cytosine(1402)-N(4))-methyltransferase RsmH [Synergistaceae bacterium]
MHHDPVMINEVLSLITSHSSHSKILDGTLGLGGYSLAFLEAFPDCSVLGLDRDTQAIAHSLDRLKTYAASGRFSALHADFSRLGEIEQCRNFDVYVFDLGVSNMQLTLPERGFSFQNDGPLDMRMNPSGQERTAADILRESDENTLAKIFWDYGEERHSRLLAHAIKHTSSPAATTGELVNVIRAALPQPVQRKMGTHPARRVFQALRIYVNDEAHELEKLLLSLPEVSHDALIIFVSYHSLEDRLIKHTFRQWQADKKGSILTKYPILPSEAETAFNYKARSGKLRAFCLKTD